MSELLARLQSDLNVARKARDKSATLVLGTILADIKNKKIELRREPVDEDVFDVLRKSIKRRRESIEMFEAGKRVDLADKERAEAVLLEHYLPASASDDEVRAGVQAAMADGASNIGAVMKAMASFRARAEGSRINAIAREELGKRS
ncbi:MAG: GatB/YqeY domain-containing protein [Anaerolineae bacterium]|nr:GatB/YqeY domain-containing protein [Gemmatimonadaceae bacterium]